MNEDINGARASNALADETARLVDQQAIFDLVRKERFARDRGDWEALANYFTEDSYVRTTWFEGTGREFAEQSRDMAVKGRHSKHPIWPIETRIMGDRAIVESYSEIQNRSLLDGVEVDMKQYCRFFSRVVRTGRGWKLASFEAIYQKDTIVAANPHEQVPIDWDEVGEFRASYRIWAWSMSKRGYAVNHDLLGDDRPDLVEAFYAEANNWLSAAGR